MSVLYVCRLISSKRGDRLYLDHHLGTRKRRDLERGRSRLPALDETALDLHVVAEPADVRQEHGQLDDVSEGSAAFLQDRLQVLEYLLCLRVEVPLADKLSLCGNRRLAGDEDERLRAGII